MKIWDDDHGPTGDGREALDLALGWGIPLAVVGLALWKATELVVDLALLTARLVR